MTVPGTITLNGVSYPIDIRKYREQSQDALRGSAVTADQPTDSLFNPEIAFSRYRTSWHHGAGQVFDDFRDDSDPFRFASSIGVEVFTEGQLTLLRKMDSYSTGHTGWMHVQVAGAYLWYSSGTSLWRVDSAGALVAASSPGGTITSLASDGSTLYVGTTTAVVKYVAGSTTATAFATPVGGVDHVAFVSGNLLIGYGATLASVASTGVLTVIKTHFQSTFIWSTLFAVGSRVYVGGYAPSQSELYSLTTTTEGLLAISNEAAVFPSGELLYCSLSYAGVALIGTSKGVRFAQPGGDGTLTYGPLISVQGAVYAITAEGRFAYCACQSTGTAGVISLRLALDTFTEPLKPAYANDCYMATSTAGLAIARFGSRTWVGTAETLWWQSATQYLTNGSVTSGRVTFGTVEPKYLTSTVLRYSGIIGDEGAQFSIAGDEVNFVASSALPAAGASATEFTISDFAGQIPFPTYTLQVLLSGGPDDTPTVRTWRLRAYPVPPTSRQWIVPIMLTPRALVGAGAGQVFPQDVTVQHAALLALHASRAPVAFVMGAVTETVRVDAFDFEASSWDDSRQWLEGVMSVRLVALT